MAPKNDSWVRRFEVSDPFKHSKGFTLYRVTSVVYRKKYPESATKIVIWKRYNDFKKLHKELKLRHQKLHLDDQFPNFVKAKFFSRFEADVIEERRQAALMLLEFVGLHSPLFTSDVFVKFFENGYTVDSEDVDVTCELKTETTAKSPLSSNSSDPGGTSVAGSLMSPGNLSNSSDEEHTSFTTDTDSAISSPLLSADLQVFESLQDSEQNSNVSSNVSNSWLLSQQLVSPNQSLSLQPPQPQNLNNSASTESLFSRKIQSLKNKFIGNNQDTNENKAKEPPVYWTEAELHVEQARTSERQDDHQAAFAFYKTAIACLLSGVQSDTDNERRRAVKEKTAEYLLKAEYIANNFLCEKNASKPAEAELVPLSQLWQPVSDLQWFKVLGIVGKVMLVFDTRTHCLHIIKALHKSACPVDENRRCIFPRQVPYMVELHAIYETDCSVYLILQHISAGKLWDYVSPYFQKQPETPARNLQGNAYVGQNLLDVEDRISVSTTDSCPSALHTVSKDYGSRSTLSSPGDSYLDLIRDYTSAKKTEPLTPVNSEVQVVLNDGVANTCTEISDSSHVYTNQNEGSNKTHDLTDNPKDEFSNPLRLCNNSLNSIEQSGNENLLSRCLMSALSDDGLYNGVLDLVHNSDLSAANDANIKTTDLVNNAEILLKSVNETLTESESLFNRVNHLELSYIDDVEDDDRTTVKGNDYFIEVKNMEMDKLSVGSNYSAKSFDITRLHAAISSKGSSPISSVGMDPQWCQLEVEGGGITEHTVRKWAAQLLVALQSLHKYGIICMDLNPENILVSGGTVRLTYFCSFPCVEPTTDMLALKKLYCAPEINSIFPVTFSADWWSYGAILYQLLTGQSLSSYHPGGIQCHTIIYIPETISIEARSLLKELLRHNPSERIGSGLLGVEEIKSHSFFAGVDWDVVYQEVDLNLTSIMQVVVEAVN